MLSKMPDIDLETLNINELRHLVYVHYNIRVHPNAPKKHLVELLSLEKLSTPQHDMNNIRDQIIEFVRSNKDKLSLFCDGDCYKHADAVVLDCYKNFLENEDAGR
jgi:hypothetical protein